jgi:hypothetical protein
MRRVCKDTGVLPFILYSIARVLAGKTAAGCRPSVIGWQQAEDPDPDLVSGVVGGSNNAEPNDARAHLEQSAPQLRAASTVHAATWHGTDTEPSVPKPRSWTASDSAASRTGSPSALAPSCSRPAGPRPTAPRATTSPWSACSADIIQTLPRRIQLELNGAPPAITASRCPNNRGRICQSTLYLPI